MSEPAFTVEPLPPFRQLVTDGMDLAGRKHRIHALVELDVTRARERLRQIRDQTGESLSFTGFIIYCCARAVAQDRRVQAYRDWRNRLITFQDVDVSLPVERPGTKHDQVLQILIRAADRKTMREIHEEIRQAQSQRLDQTPWGRNLRWYVLVPAFIRRLLFRLLSSSPHLLRKMNGTIMVTAVGMFGSGAGWGIPLTGHTLCVTIGGIVSRPAIVDGRIVDREHLCLTATFDHDIVDGAPAARFTERLRELVECGSGLFEL